jgi:hypothetical protein
VAVIIVASRHIAGDVADTVVEESAGAASSAVCDHYELADSGVRSVPGGAGSEAIISVKVIVGRTGSALRSGFAACQTHRITIQAISI